MNINWLLKDIKSEICTDFIYFNNRGIVVTTNKIVSTSDTNAIKKYTRNLNNINLNEVMSPELS